MIKLVSDKGEEVEYLSLPGGNAMVSAGDLITAGQQLSDGHIDLKERLGQLKQNLQQEFGRDRIWVTVHEIHRITAGNP